MDFPTSTFSIRALIPAADALVRRVLLDGRRVDDALLLVPAADEDDDSTDADYDGGRRVPPLPRRTQPPRGASGGAR